MAIRRIRARTSGAVAGRPVRWRLFHAQNRRNPRRCQASTVSGLTRTSADRHSIHACDSQAQSSRSTAVRRSRGDRERFRTATCHSVCLCDRPIADRREFREWFRRYDRRTAASTDAGSAVCWAGNRDGARHSISGLARSVRRLGRPGSCGTSPSRTPMGSRADSQPGCQVE